MGHPTQTPETPAPSGGAGDTAKIVMRPSDFAVLDRLVDGESLGRHAGVRLLALRTKLEYALPKPKQEHELTGSVTIVVQSPIPTRAGMLREAKAALVATSEPEVLCLQQGPITYIPSTEKDGDDAASEPAVMAVDVMEAGTLHRVGRLKAHPSVAMTAEQRRAAARAEWMADAHGQPDTVARSENGDDGSGA